MYACRIFFKKSLVGYICMIITRRTIKKSQVFKYTFYELKFIIESSPCGPPPASSKKTATCSNQESYEFLFQREKM